MTLKLSYTIPEKKKRCDIILRHGLLDSFYEMLPKDRQLAFITDSTVAKIYGHRIKENFSSLHLKASFFEFNSGEANKTRATKERLEDSLLNAKFNKDSCLIAIGGGVVTDLSGYIAACYCRGIPFISIPTTLLGMVDASIGGKVAVNAPHGKNIFGSYHQPKMVLIDPLTLKTLPLDELKNGFVEMIKHGVVGCKSHFIFLEKNFKELLNLDNSFLDKSIIDSCQIKCSIVEKDEQDSSMRHLLNFGHTIAHALETLSHYSISHGRAVAIGLVVESYLSMQLGKLSEDSFKRIHNALKSYGLSFTLPRKYSEDEMIQAMSLDKKSIDKTPRFVLINEIGRPYQEENIYTFAIEKSTLKHAIQWMNDDLCCH